MQWLKRAKEFLLGKDEGDDRKNAIPPPLKVSKRRLFRPFVAEPVLQEPSETAAGVQASRHVYHAPRTSARLSLADCAWPLDRACHGLSGV